MPAHGVDCAFVAPVALLVALDFRFPPLRAGRGQTEVLAMLMAVPEAAVDEDHGLVFWQDEVGPPWQGPVLGAVHREAVTEPVKHRAQRQLGFRVASPDAGHDFGALFGTEDVGHRENKS